MTRDFVFSACISALMTKNRKRWRRWMPLPLSRGIGLIFQRHASTMKFISAILDVLHRGH